uniref:CDP-glycerol:poly(Glycerophosphate) glycerophosphotransferase n=1 Tax=uncultured Desulfobacterium sp. TaxID=201089 RepID=E1YA67_9BACT|nr:hypothetical protein N47_H22830 [uncultured Desulfobacterium sp.]
MGWVFGFPLTLLIKRVPNLIVVFSRPGPVFADNSKYFFLYATSLRDNKVSTIFLTESTSIQQSIIHAGGKAIMHPSIQSIVVLLRCGKIVTDCADWSNFGAYALTRGAKTIQIWHGAPLKHIELDLYRKRLQLTPFRLRSLLKIQKKILGRYPLYDVVVATSKQFIKEAFKKSFRAKKFIATGYPRNDILFGLPEGNTTAEKLALINVDKKVIEIIKEKRAQGIGICLYVPTFRKDMTDPFEVAINLKRFSEISKKFNLLTVLKLHPVVKKYYNIIHDDSLIEYPPLADVYPIMKLCDFMITDYSSIFFDYLLLDRPIIFFSYDLANYLSNDRDMYFDYHSMTPGVKCYNYDELEYNIELLLKSGCIDKYADFRKRITDFTHDHIDNYSTRRLYDEVLRI